MKKMTKGQTCIVIGLIGLIACSFVGMPLIGAIFFVSVFVVAYVPVP